MRIFLLFLWLSPLCLQGQQLDNLKNEKPIQFSGGININTYAYRTTRDKASYSPLSWTISASPTLALYGFSIPFTVVVSEQERSFQQPFNKFGLSPSYSWATAHLGHRSVNFSPYTLGGRTFLGGGLELNPSKFRIGAVYGRFNRATEFNLNQPVFHQPSFDRMGYALKFGMGTTSDFVDFSLLKAWDSFDSERVDSLAEVGVFPAENLVLGVKAFQQLGAKFTFQTNVGFSAYTSNREAERAELTYPFQGIFDRFFTIRESTAFGWAGDASLNFKLSTLSFQLSYKRIDPSFQSMGAYFFLTDVEDLTVGSSWSMLKKKLRISGKVGVQRNNLKAAQLQSSLRKVGSLNLNFTTSKGFSARLGYSNMQSEAFTADEDILSDSFNLSQVSQNVNAGLSYVMGKERRQSFSLSGNRQHFQNITENNTQSSENQNFNINGSYRVFHKANQFGWGLSTYFSRNQSLAKITNRYGLGLNLRKSFQDKKWNLQSSTRFYRNLCNGMPDGNSLSVRASLRYRLGERQNFSFSTSYIHRDFAGSDKSGYSDWRGSLSYGVSW